MARPGDPLSVLTPAEQRLVLLGVLVPGVVTALGLFVVAEVSPRWGLGVALLGALALAGSCLVTWRARRARERQAVEPRPASGSADAGAGPGENPPRDWRGFALRTAFSAVVWTLLAGLVVLLPWDLSPAAVVGPALGWVALDLVTTIRGREPFSPR